MQKQKIAPLYLVLHSDYEQVFCGLYQGTAMLATAHEHKIKASKNLMCMLGELLEQQNVSWSDLDFIGVNQGPSPFTTLRVVITTVNGLLLSQQTPLVGVDGLEAFVSTYTQPHGLVIALLNAFNNDVYFAIKQPDGSVTTGWEFNATLLQSLHTKYAATPITFIGNGVIMHQGRIENFFPDAHFPNQIPHTVDLKTVATRALEQWDDKKFTTEPLLPLYLKTLEYKQST